MDFLTENSTLQLWLLNYGSFALFLLLVVGILALPVPEETLMVVAGILMHQEKLHIPHTIIAALLGSICGITTSYLLGRTAGLYLIHKYGKWLGINQGHIDKTHVWFERFGKWTLFVGYFIPGVRHFTGFIAGMSSLAFKEFALFAYTGGILWVTTFLSIGYYFDTYWYQFYQNIEVTLDDGVSVLFIAFFIYLIYLVKKQKIQE